MNKGKTVDAPAVLVTADSTPDSTPDGTPDSTPPAPLSQQFPGAAVCALPIV